jgi:transposase
LKTTLVEAAQGASRSKGTYLKSKYHKVASRRGRKRAIVAVGHKILIAAYYIIRDKTSYADLGEEYLDQRQKRNLSRYYLRKLDQLGVRVQLSEPLEDRKAA